MGPIATVVMNSNSEVNIVRPSIRNLIPLPCVSTPKRTEKKISHPLILATHSKLPFDQVQLVIIQVILSKNISFSKVTYKIKVIDQLLDQKLGISILQVDLHQNHLHILRETLNRKRHFDILHNQSVPGFATLIIHYFLFNVFGRLRTNYSNRWILKNVREKKILEFIP